MRRTATLLLLALLGFPAAAQVYKWTDSTGKTVYGDKPPEDARAQELRIQTHDQPAVVRDWSKVLKAKSPAAPASQAGVTMYSTSWCGVCRTARAYFAAKNVAFTEIDVEKSAEGARRFKEYGGSGVPLIVVGGKTMRGWSPGAFEAMRRN